MSDENNKAGQALQKLGQRLRLGLHHRRSVNEKTSDAVMDTIRAQFPKELEERRKLATEHGKKSTKLSPFQAPKLAKKPKKDEW